MRKSVIYEIRKNAFHSGAFFILCAVLATCGGFFVRNGLWWQAILSMVLAVLCMWGSFALFPFIESIDMDTVRRKGGPREGESMREWLDRLQDEIDDEDDGEGGEPVRVVVRKGDDANA